MFSGRFQDAFKLALAMTLTAWASLSLGWEDPKWALFAVSFCFLGTGGETLAKGLMRIGGTLIGAVLALTFLALFAQDRWAYALAVATWLFICGWFLSGNSRIWYVWFVGGFLVILLTEYSQLDSKTAFDIVMLRLQQTLLGILIYNLVESLIFSNPAQDSFKQDLRRQVDHARTGFALLAAQFQGKQSASGDREKVRELRHTAIQLQAMLTSRLDGATVESFDMLEHRRAWQRAVSETAALIEGFARLRLSLANLHEGDTAPDLSSLDAVLSEIGHRLDETHRLLGEAEQVRWPQSITLPAARTAFADADLFTKGALEVSFDALYEILRASEALLLAVAEGQGFANEGQIPAAHGHQLPRSVIPDPERLAIALRVSVNFILAFLIFILLPGFPAVTMLLVLAVNMPLFLSRAPATPTGIVALIGMIAIAFGSVLHIFVMPKMTSFLGLGTMIFVASFAITYLFSAPKLVIARILGLGVMVILMQLDNQQSYNFLFTINMAVAFLFPFALLWFTAMFPISFRPEEAFHRLLRRYLQSYLALLDTMTQDPRESDRWWARQVRAYHLRQIQDIPPRLTQWLGAIPDSMLPGDGREQAANMIESLQGLSLRFRHLYRMSQSDAFRASHKLLLPEIIEWRDGVTRICRTLKDSPDSLRKTDGLPSSDIARMTNLVHSLLERHSAKPTEGQGHDLLQELAALRGVTEAVGDMLRPASSIDWHRLKEARL